MMVLILVRCPMCCPLKALMTRKKTRTGAMAFNAPTKISPSMDITVTCGIVSPRIRPRISPQMIRLMRLI